MEESIFVKLVIYLQLSDSLNDWAYLFLVYTTSIEDKRCSFSKVLIESVFLQYLDNLLKKKMHFYLYPPRSFVVSTEIGEDIV
jgi:hypothetical protein